MANERISVPASELGAAISRLGLDVRILFGGITGHSTVIFSKKGILGTTEVRLSLDMPAALYGHRLDDPRLLETLDKWSIPFTIESGVK